jgi:MEDS: MEthanogen/methylotroph, DcmR Sensory domain
MTSRTTSLLTDPQPHSHIVYPCTDETSIGEAVVTFASAGLRKGDAIILITTEARRELIEDRLTYESFDVKELQASGQLAFIDAGTMLSDLVTDGSLDAAKFKSAVERVIDRAASGDNAPRKVRIFGEMVSLLYGVNEIPAAEKLEEFWNQLVASRSVSLFCAYSLVLHAPSPFPQSLIDAHTRTIHSSE